MVTKEHQRQLAARNCHTSATALARSRRSTGCEVRSRLLRRIALHSGKTFARCAFSFKVAALDSHCRFLLRFIYHGFDDPAAEVAWLAPNRAKTRYPAKIKISE